MKVLPLDKWSVGELLNGAVKYTYEAMGQTLALEVRSKDAYKRRWEIFEEAERRDGELERLQKENDDLRLQLQAARDQLAYAPQWVTGTDEACPDCDKSIINVYRGSEIVARVTLDGEALEPTPPDGQMHYFFNTFSGPYRALDTRQEREYSWSRGPFGSWNEADKGWKEYIRQQDKDGKL